MSARVNCGRTPATRRDIAAYVSVKTGLPPDAASAAVAAAVDAMTEALSDGRGLELRGFGAIHVVLHKARVGRNPRKPAEEVEIPARIRYKFRPGRLLKEGGAE
ncbi:MAG TPA: HU family DNA-binding protein [Candidatus Hydrogenedentes bacterium]|nr:HU family DNA-binding protein [Candidatus Hydrogenedentota bacterium]